jgi:hypothetical protein
VNCGLDGERVRRAGGHGGALFRYRVALGVFLFGLVVSGLTAFPLWSELYLAAKVFGVNEPGSYHTGNGVAYWIGYVFEGLDVTYRKYPFFGYGTDWLGFGHLVIAAFFVKPLIEPRGNRWVLVCGIAACAGVIPLALVAGEVREIPIFWRLIDCSFGIFGAIPLFYCLWLSRKNGW